MTHHTVYEWRNINANAAEVFSLVSSEKFMKLTGADEIEFDFREGGAFRLNFRGRGEISGTVEEIIPYHRIALDWNVKGFSRPDEEHTRVTILLGSTKGTDVSIEHSGIKSEEAAGAKRKAWSEILDELKKLLEH
jgi:uncharacterized protein YndB with AHSA1/START domain